MGLVVDVAEVLREAQQRPEVRDAAENLAALRGLAGDRCALDACAHHDQVVGRAVEFSRIRAHRGGIMARAAATLHCFVAPKVATLPG